MKDTPQQEMTRQFRDGFVAGINHGMPKKQMPEHWQAGFRKGLLYRKQLTEFAREYVKELSHDRV